MTWILVAAYSALTAPVRIILAVNTEEDCRSEGGGQDRRQGECVGCWRNDEFLEADAVASQRAPELAELAHNSRSAAAANHGRSILITSMTSTLH